MAINGLGVRDTARVLRISRNTVSSQLKKKSRVMHVNPKYADKGLTIRLKVDEMWSFVSCKVLPRWLWWVEEETTGEVVAFVFGRRTHATFRRLLALLKKAQLQVGGWITDAWCGAARVGLLRLPGSNTTSGEQILITKSGTQAFNTAYSVETAHSSHDLFF